jgi:protein-tyrosine phosphatase
MELYDMHSHILPEMDDGANSIDVSVKMLNTLKEQGVNHICLTPHYYSHKESMEDFLLRRQECFNLLLPHIPSGIEVCLGAEVYITDIILNNKSVSPVCYGNSNYILLEFPYSTSFQGSSYDFLIRFMNLYGVKPILAHIERYDALIKNPDLLEDLASYGIKFQTNAISYLDKSNFRRFKKLIKKGLIHYIGSDAHNMIRNSPDKFKEATQLIEAKTSPNVMKAINHFSKKVFEQAVK